MIRSPPDHLRAGSRRTHGHTGYRTRRKRSGGAGFQQPSIPAKSPTMVLNPISVLLFPPMDKFFPCKTPGATPRRRQRRAVRGSAGKHAPTFRPFARGGHPRPLSPLAPRGVNIYVGCTRNGRIPAIRRPASSAGPATRGARNRTLHRPRRPWSFYHNQNGGHLPHSAASRPPPPFFGRDFTRLQARHTATGDARRIRPHGWWPRPAHHDATRSRTRSPRAPFQHGRNGPRQPPAPSFPRPAPHASRI